MKKKDTRSSFVYIIILISVAQDLFLPSEMWKREEKKNMKRIKYVQPYYTAIML